MKQLKDPTKNAVRNVIEPGLSEFGFVRSKEKDFYRVRGPLMDKIYFGFGRWGSDVIYVYYSVHLIEDPVTSVHTYQAGDRLSASWSPENHEACIESAEMILRDIKTFAFPWFNEIDSVHKYEGAWFDSGIAAAFAAIARNDLVNARIYLRDAIARRAPLIYSSGYPGWRSNEYGRDQEEIDALELALAAIEAGTVGAWRQEIRRQKFIQLGIAKA